MSGRFVRSAATRPYVAGLGWAPEDSRWLVVTVVPGAPTAFEGRRGTYQVRGVGVETSYGLGFEEPVEVYAANDLLPDSVEPDPLDPQVVVFEVPADRGPGPARHPQPADRAAAGRAPDRTARALVVQGAFV